MTASTEFPQYQWVQARSWTRGRKTGQPTVIFIHTTEGSEGRTSAEDGAAYDQRRTDGTSTHFFCDQDTTVQCVKTYDEAHHARYHGNDVGIGIENCGRAGQTDAQWADAASAGTIEQCARVSAALRKRYGKARFPLVNLTPAQLRAGARGFAEHKDATEAWPEDGGSHWDPGPNFPWTKLFDRIRALEGTTVREYTFRPVSGNLPELRIGDEDVQGKTGYIKRVQRLLGIEDDGVYGPQTAAALDTRMTGQQAYTPSSTDGSKLYESEWRVLYALWS